MKLNNLIYFIIIVVLISCQRDIPYIKPFEYNPIPVVFEKPVNFPYPNLPEDNPLTEEGIKLGKKLFYDPILSGNNTMSCADCHFQANSFSDPAQFSVGIEGVLGSMNASTIVNAAWNTSNFWDGRAISLEEQAFGPVTSFIELHSPSWNEVSQKLMAKDEYKRLFREAFNTNLIDSNHVVKAIAQFERILISADSKFDKFLDYRASLTPSELRGKEIFETEKAIVFIATPIHYLLATIFIITELTLKMKWEMEDTMLLLTSTIKANL